ncbi:hypothetical protein Tsubulata_023810 [Turnera subulata]|uniref:HMA domain-containing protein n=1 Tax=Turnera subulata TaxID=218843 RepID=A0A9Q0G4K0_9ROSI|nr:hypothetical protein Tsubulata_023810 [Turnera subulata]
MKRMDFFCASPASTAICSSLDHRSMVRHGSTRPLSRQNSSKPYAPCSSHILPHSPKPYHERSRKSSSAKESDGLYRKSFAADSRESTSRQSSTLRRKSSADISDLRSPSSSSRYLLSDIPYIDLISEYDHHYHYSSALVPVQHEKLRHKDSSNESPALKKSSSSSSSSGCRSRLVHESDHQVTALVPTQTTKPVRRRISNDSPALISSSSARSRDQVVVLRVSIHCKGCEGKVRKHISKMEGVTSFSIDLATKKVTVIGDVTPLGVLASLSKVKNAQLWPSPATPSASLPSPAPRWST